MLRTVGAMLGLVVFVGGLGADDTKAKPDAKKDAKKDAQQVSALITKVDVAGKTITLKFDDGKQMDLTVDEETKIQGPRGGASRAGIKDDRLHVGAKIKVVVDGKMLKEIHLASRPPRDRNRDSGAATPPPAKDADAKDKKPASKTKDDK